MSERIKPKDIKPFFKKTDFIRWVLTGLLIYVAYFETGKYTTVIFSLLFLSVESSVILGRIQDKKDKLLVATLDAFIKLAKKDE